MSRVQSYVEPYVPMDFIQPWLQSILVGAWTAFETLAADLWIAAVNSNPGSLAKLSGTSSRTLTGRDLKKDKRDGGQGAEMDGFNIRLGDIYAMTNGNFDIRNRMGEILSEKFKFKSLYGIRIAYAKAFTEKEKRYDYKLLDEKFKNKTLDAISAMRHVIVHQAAIADDDYQDDQKETDNNAPRLEIGEKLVLNGEQVDRLLTDLVSVCVGIIETVDRWLKFTGSKKWISK